jgi:hypothetical protein
MRWSPTRVDTVPTGTAARSEPAPNAQHRPGTLVLIARAAAHDRISSALRDAREHAGLSEHEVVERLHARGASISASALLRWERTGGIQLEDAVALAAVYDMSLDDLAGRRSWNARFLGTLERTRPDSE